MDMNDINLGGPATEADLKVVLNHPLVESADLEMEGMGFGTGVLKDGRPFEFGRVNGLLEISIFESVKAMENGEEPKEFIEL